MTTGGFRSEQLHSARRLLGRLRSIRLSSEDHIDLIGRLEILTVAMGLRPVAAFGFRERQWPAAEIKRVLESVALKCVATDSIRLTPEESPRELPAELDDVFDRVDAELGGRTEELLWVFSDDNVAPRVRTVVSGQALAGILLAYPPCCVDLRTRGIRSQRIAFRKAIIEAVGTEPAAIEKALRTDLKVEIPDPVSYANGEVTRRVFPFVFHIACDECLSGKHALTKDLNEAYGSLARTVDRSLHQGLIDLAKIDAEVVGIISDAERRGLVAGQLEPQTNRRLQRLFREAHRIFERTIGR